VGFIVFVFFKPRVFFLGRFFFTTTLTQAL